MTRPIASIQQDINRRSDALRMLRLTIPYTFSPYRREQMALTCRAEEQALDALWEERRRVLASLRAGQRDARIQQQMMRARARQWTQQTARRFTGAFKRNLPFTGRVARAYPA